MSRFIITELKSDSDLNSEKVGKKIDTKLMTKLKADFDSE